jgi:hypothetical protein
MAINFSGLSGIFNQIDMHVEAKLVLDGKEYEIEHFGASSQLCALSVQYAYGYLIRFNCLIINLL